MPPGYQVRCVCPQPEPVLIDVPLQERFGNMSVL
jgi:hypothetical protein